MELTVGQIVEGKITGITKFGVFADLGDGKTGMVHISEVASTYVNEIRDHVKENDVVNFNAYRIETEGFMPDKVCLSLYPTHSIEFHVRKSFRELDLSLL
jgi:S1 RNA binding domain protein